MSIERKTLPDQHYIYVDREASYAGSEIADAMASGFAAVFTALETAQIKALSMPMSVYTAMPSGDKVAFRAGVFVSGEDAGQIAGDVKSDTIAAGDVLTTTHVGAYATMHESHKALWDHLSAAGMSPGFPIWEIYVDDPSQTAESDVRTEIYHAIDR